MLVYHCQLQNGQGRVFWGPSNFNRLEPRGSSIRPGERSRRERNIANVSDLPRRCATRNFEGQGSDVSINGPLGQFWSFRGKKIFEAMRNEFKKLSKRVNIRYSTKREGVVTPIRPLFSCAPTSWKKKFTK